MSSNVHKYAEEVNQRYIDGKHVALYTDEFLERFSHFFPSIAKGELTMITGSTGSGKTQFSKALAVNYPIEYKKKNNVDLKIIYICLEETELEFKQKMTISFLHEIWPQYNMPYNCDIVYGHLNGTKRRRRFKDDGKLFNTKELELIEEASKMAEKVMSHIYLITDVTTPTVMYRKCEEIAKEWGDYDYEDHIIEIEDPMTGEKSRQKERIINYKPKENEHVILITDHLQLFLPEKDPISKKVSDERGTILKWNTYYCRAIFCKKFNWSVINIIQQNFDTDKLKTSMSGEKLIQQAKPSLGNIGNARESARDAHNVIALFNPNKFHLPKYEGYDLTLMGDTFRAVIVLKSRNGSANIEVQVLFDGACQGFEELPFDPEHPTMDNYFYPKAQMINNR